MMDAPVAVVFGHSGAAKTYPPPNLAPLAVAS